MTPRRIIRIFMPQFAPLVETGAKLQTVRPTPKIMPRVGDIFDARAWTGRPYRSKQRLLREAPIIQVRLLRLTDGASQLWLDGEMQHWTVMPDFACKDGFVGTREMLEWFRSQHGLPFEGIVIYWAPQ